ncbi:MAG: sulfate adenylyltransferase subunit CysN [Gammaproteobacteria bacterium]|nr:MAG: sulfate adenylyltransferase subunit CysN [Gammaproteobacteria bacterium]
MPQDIESYLREQGDKTTLRFLTCGSVDDGKSTLIGRLLYDSKLIFEDQLAALEADSKKQGTQGDDIDFALLVDGLAAEREQGITIDVAYRYFATDKRKFVVADTPGHEQYTRNMATGASTAELAVILIDARKGVLTQTRRHSYIVSLFGIKEVLLAVNKMDLVGYDESTYRAIVASYSQFAQELGEVGKLNITAIPISALRGDNVIKASTHMQWHEGPTLLEALETVQIDSDLGSKPFRMPVQWVNRPDLDFRGYSGTIASGRVKPGAEILILPSERRSVVTRIVTYDGDLPVAGPGQAVTLVLADEVDVSRGDVISSVSEPAQLSDQFAVHLLWMSERALFPGRQYYLKTGTRTVPCVVTDLKHKVNVNTLETQAAKRLELNEIGVGNISLSERIAYEPYRESRQLGSFILIDRQTYASVGVGLFDFSLRRAANVTWQALSVDKEHRAAIKHQKPCVVWLTGLSGSGKSTIANLLESRLHDLNRHTYVLDGDNVRHGLNRDLGFTEADRVENIRRIGETAKLMVDAGLITIVAFISPFRSERRMVRDLMCEGEFFEVFVDTPLEVCEARDTKGLYKKARAGEIQNFTGIDSVYEPPEEAEMVMHTEKESAEEAVERLLVSLRERGILTVD